MTKFNGMGFVIEDREQTNCTIQESCHAQLTNPGQFHAYNNAHSSENKARSKAHNERTNGLLYDKMKVLFLH